MQILKKYYFIWLLLSFSISYGMEEQIEEQEEQYEENKKSVFLPSLKQICMPVILDTCEIGSYKAKLPQELFDALVDYATVVSKGLLITNFLLSKFERGPGGRIYINESDLTWHPKAKGVTFNIRNNKKEFLRSFKLEFNNIKSVLAVCMNPIHVQEIVEAYGYCSPRFNRQNPCFALHAFDSAEKKCQLYDVLRFCNTSRDQNRLNNLLNEEEREKAQQMIASYLSVCNVMPCQKYSIVTYEGRPVNIEGKENSEITVNNVLAVAFARLQARATEYGLKLHSSSRLLQKIDFKFSDVNKNIAIVKALLLPQLYYDKGPLPRENDHRNVLK